LRIRYDAPVTLTFAPVSTRVLVLDLVLGLFTADDISQFAHLAGGACGGLFGFFIEKKAKPLTGVRRT
jgi:hypothetical protein